jgi:hypothetical protein
MDGLYDLRRTIIQRKSIVYPKMLSEGQFVKGETQWRIGWTLWPF